MLVSELSWQQQPIPYFFFLGTLKSRPNSLPCAAHTEGFQNGQQLDVASISSSGNGNLYSVVLFGDGRCLSYCAHVVQWFGQMVKGAVGCAASQTKSGQYDVAHQHRTSSLMNADLELIDRLTVTLIFFFLLPIT